MAEQTFETFITKERERLHKLREDALARRATIDAELAVADRELSAIAAYEAAKQGKPVEIKAARKTGPRGPRQTGKREEVYQLVRQHANGATRADLIEQLDIKGDKKAEQSLSNALSALKRDGRLTTDGKTYMAAQAA